MGKKITFRNLEIQAWIWLGLPMLLFLYGWMRWYVSLPLGLMIVLAGRTARVRIIFLICFIGMSWSDSV